MKISAPCATKTRPGKTRTVFDPGRYFFALALPLFFCDPTLLAAPVHREFYLSPQGTDANPGTSEKPFLTPTHARDAIRNVGPQMRGDIVVYSRGGTYPIAAPIELNNAWLYVWTPRIHDLKIDSNYASPSRNINKGTNTAPTNTHMEAPFSAEAQKIMDASGLEPAYMDIAGG